MRQQYVLGWSDVRPAMEAMLAEAGKNPDRPVTIIVIDHHADPIALVRMDGSGAGAVTVATKKAYTALKTKVPTSKVVEHLAARGRELHDTGDPLVIAFPGGVPIIHPNGQRLGAIGTSGYPGHDEVISQLGLSALKLE